MTTKLTDFKQSLIRELTGFIRNQADVLSLRDLHQLITDLPAVRERLRKTIVLLLHVFGEYVVSLRFDLEEAPPKRLPRYEPLLYATKSVVVDYF
jgi:hypothetical protein